ncbi:MAG: hypothetical protein ACTSPT_01730 [Candidatus Heimdallarchaeota archaeon]
MDSFVAEKEKETTKADTLALDEHQEPMEQDDQPEIVTRDIKRRNYTLEIAAGAILGSLSVLIGIIWDLTLEPAFWGPQFAPGMTWLDIMAVPMLVAFLIFGIRSGLIAATIGSTAIIFFPNEVNTGFIAMWPKFIASITMFVVPWIFLKTISRKESDNKFRNRFKNSSDSLENIGTYTFLMVIAILSRMLIMLILNSLVFGPAFFVVLNITPTWEFMFASKELFVKYISLGAGYAAWNGVQGISDAVIAYLLVFPTKLHKVFKAW